MILKIRSAYPWPDMKSHLVKKNIQDLITGQLISLVEERHGSLEFIRWPDKKKKRVLR